MLVVPNIYDLLSVPYADRNELPPRPGVYFVFSFPKVYYIGSTTNLFTRWSGNSHHRSAQVETLIAARLYWMEADAKEINQIEIMCRELYRPVWNQTKVRK